MGRVTIGARSAREWYQESERWYVAGHQGCPWCHGQHCVIRSDWSGLVEFFCSVCDFSACHDRTRGEEFIATGGKLSDSGLVRAAAASVVNRSLETTSTP
jgi:hypothetical protein